MITITPVALAYAQEATSSAGSGLIGMLPIVLIFVVFYFLLIRPQQKRAKMHKEMLGKVEKGDNVITTGGIYGRVTSVGDDSIMVEIADNVKIKLAKDAIGSRKPKG